jgi:hypothetical protein
MRKLRYDVETERTGYVVFLGGGENSGGFNFCFFTVNSIPETSLITCVGSAGRRNLIPTASRRFIFY